MGLIAALSGCSDDVAQAQVLRAELEDAGEMRPGRIAQIRIVAHVSNDSGVSTSLSGEARFAVFHGMDAEFAQSRIDLTESASDRLSLGKCVDANSELVRVEVGRAGPLSWRDLDLVDVGNISLRLGGQELPLTYALAPDLISWMSGIEYRHHEDSLPLGARGEHAATPIRLSVSGSPEEEFPEFEADASLPATVTDLRLRVEPDKESPTLTWAQASAGQWPLLVKIRRGDAGIDCLVPDLGQFSIPAELLADTGFVGSRERVQVGDRFDLSVTRFDYLNLAAGLFEDIDLVRETQVENELVAQASATTDRR